MKEQELKDSGNGIVGVGDIHDKFRACETEEDFKDFFKWYYAIVEDTICKEKSLHPGDKRPFGEAMQRTASNMMWLLDGLDEMRRDYAREIYWFL